MEITAIIILIVISVAIINTLYSTKYKVVNMPSAPETRRTIINDIKQTYPDHHNLNIYDCGSGWGGLCRKLSNAFPHAHVTGVEISPIPFLVSYFWPMKQYKVIRDDLFNMDSEKADILIFYLSPYHMDKLKTALDKNNLQGKIIYSQGFPIKGWAPSKELDVRYSLEKKLYRYDF